MQLKMQADSNKLSFKEQKFLTIIIIIYKTFLHITNINSGTA